MDRLTAWCLRFAAVAVAAWFVWLLTSQTVVALVSLSNRLQACEARMMAPASGGPSAPGR